MLVSGYSLKDSEQVLHHVIQLFVETTRLEALPADQMILNFPGWVFIAAAHKLSHILFHYNLQPIIHVTYMYI